MVSPTLLLMLQHPLMVKHLWCKIYVFHNHSSSFSLSCLASRWCQNLYLVKLLFDKTLFLDLQEHFRCSQGQDISISAVAVEQRVFWFCRILVNWNVIPFLGPTVLVRGKGISEQCSYWTGCLNPFSSQVRF